MPATTEQGASISRAGSTCTACGSRWDAEVEARWCGACGANLDDVGGTDGRDEATASGVATSAVTRRRSRRTAVLLIGLAVVAVVVVASVAGVESADGPDLSGDEAEVVVDPDMAEEAPDPTEDVETLEVRGGPPRCVDGGDGCLAWSLPVEGDGLPAVGVRLDLGPSDMMVVADDQIRAIDPLDGSVVWTVDAPPQDLGGSRGAVLGDDLAFVLAGSAEADDRTTYLVALELADGSERWRTSLGTDALIRDGAVIDDTLVIATLGAGNTSDRSLERVVGVAVDDGTERWTRDVRTAAVGDAGPLAVEDDDLVGLDVADGEPIWREPIDDPDAWLLAIGSVMMLSSDGVPQLRSAVDGRLLVEQLNGAGPLAPPLPDGRVLLATVDGVLVVDGDELVATLPTEEVCCTGAAMIDDRTVVAREVTGELSVFDLDDATELMRLDGPPGTDHLDGDFAAGLLVDHAETTTEIVDAFDGSPVATIDDLAFAVALVDGVAVFASESYVFALPTPELDLPS